MTTYIPLHDEVHVARIVLNQFGDREYGYPPSGGETLLVAAICALDPDLQDQVGQSFPELVDAVQTAQRVGLTPLRDTIDCAVNA